MRKGLAIAGSIVFIVLMAACGTGEDSVTTTDETAQTEAVTSEEVLTVTDVPTQETTEEPAVEPTAEPMAEPTPAPTETPVPTPTEVPHEHAYTESVSKEATCTETGEKTFTCECGDTYTENIEATGHNYEVVADSSVEPTCTKEGKEADETCSLCGDIINGEVVTVTGHSYGNYVYNNDATYEKDGTETATCSSCGKKNTRTKSGTKLVKDEPPYGETVNVPGLPFVPLQIYDEGNVVYYWRSIYHYGNREQLEQSEKLYEECLQIIRERYDNFGWDNQYESYYYECSWGNTYKDGKAHICYDKFAFYAIE